jgi:hypothetical protein
MQKGLKCGTLSKVKSGTKPITLSCEKPTRRPSRHQQDTPAATPHRSPHPTPYQQSPLSISSGVLTSFSLSPSPFSRVDLRRLACLLHHIRTRTQPRHTGSSLFKSASRTVDYYPFSESHLARSRWTTRPCVALIWSRNTQNIEGTKLS